jgi:hypothetical protein
LRFKAVFLLSGRIILHFEQIVTDWIAERDESEKSEEKKMNESRKQFETDETSKKYLMLKRMNKPL